MKNFQRDFKGVWIPKNLWLDPDLNVIEMVILVEIDSLDKGDGCGASNEYLAEFLRGRVTPGSVANIISDLRKRGYVVNRGFDGRNRYISLHENVKAGFMKSLRQVSFEDKGSLRENVKADPRKTLRQPSGNHDYINESNIKNKTTPPNPPLTETVTPKPGKHPRTDETCGENETSTRQEKSFEERAREALSFYGSLSPEEKKKFESGALGLNGFGSPAPARGSAGMKRLLVAWYEETRASGDSREGKSE